MCVLVRGQLTARVSSLLLPRGPEAQTQAIRTGSSKHPSLLNPLAGPEGTKLQQAPTKGTEQNPFPGFLTHHKPSALSTTPPCRLWDCPASSLHVVCRMSIGWFPTARSCHIPRQQKARGDFKRLGSPPYSLGVVTFPPNMALGCTGS